MLLVHVTLARCTGQIGNYLRTLYQPEVIYSQMRWGDDHMHRNKTGPGQLKCKGEAEVTHKQNESEYLMPRWRFRPGTSGINICHTTACAELYTPIVWSGWTNRRFQRCKTVTQQMVQRYLQNYSIKLYTFQMLWAQAIVKKVIYNSDYLRMANFLTSRVTLSFYRRALFQGVS
jgi:hypothetical protein